MPKALKVHKLRQNRDGYTWWACKPDVSVMSRIERSTIKWDKVTCTKCLKSRS